jgi:hypothetical protein
MKKFRHALLLAAALAVFASHANAQVVGGVRGSGSAGYPPGATPQIGITNGADTTGVGASITPSASQYAYLCSFEINGLGATAATTVTPTISGTAGGAPTFQGQYTFPLGATVVATPLIRSYSQCMRGAGLGQALNINVPGAAGNTTTNITVYGYVQ